LRGNFGTSSVLVVWCAQLCVSVSRCLRVPLWVHPVSWALLRSCSFAAGVVPRSYCPVSQVLVNLYTVKSRAIYGCLRSRIVVTWKLTRDSVSVSLSLCLCLTGAQSRLANNVHDNIPATLRGDFKVDQDGRRATAGARTNRARPDRARSAARDKTELSLCRCPCSRTSRPSLPQRQFFCRTPYLI
jgi:hypothetical protein